MAKKPSRPSDDRTPELEIPLPDKGETGSESYWGDEIDMAEKRKKKAITIWRRNTESYNGAKPRLTGIPPAEVIAVNFDFINVEQKRPQLFYQCPDLIVTPKQGATQQSAFMVQSVLNYYLSRDEINAEAVMDDVLYDVICASGLSPTKVYYDNRTVPVQVPSGRLDPMTQQPALGPDGRPEMTEMTKIIWEEYGFKHISPAKLLLPAGWISSDYDRAPWVGWEFDHDVDHLGRLTGMKADRIGSYPDDQTLALADDREVMRTTGRAYELFYRAYLFDETVVNPELIRQQVEGGLLHALVNAAGPAPEIVAGVVRARPLAALGLGSLRAVPKVDVQVMASMDEPGGVSGLGSLVLAAAVGNAIYAATGQRLRRLPFDPMSPA